MKPVDYFVLLCQMRGIPSIDGGPNPSPERRAEATRMIRWYVVEAYNGSSTALDDLASLVEKGLNRTDVLSFGVGKDVSVSELFNRATRRSHELRRQKRLAAMAEQNGRLGKQRRTVGVEETTRVDVGICDIRLSRPVDAQNLRIESPRHVRFVRIGPINDDLHYRVMLWDDAGLAVDGEFRVSEEVSTDYRSAYPASMVERAALEKELADTRRGAELIQESLRQTIESRDEEFQRRLDLEAELGRKDDRIQELGSMIQALEEQAAADRALFDRLVVENVGLSKKVYSRVAATCTCGRYPVGQCSRCAYDDLYEARRVNDNHRTVSDLSGRVLEEVGVVICDIEIALSSLVPVPGIFHDPRGKDVGPDAGKVVKSIEIENSRRSLRIAIGRLEALRKFR